MSWIRSAGLAGSRALRVGLYLLHLRGMRKTSEDLLVTRKGAFQVLGIERSTLARGLSKLEKVGLIIATRGRGKGIRVTLLKLEEPTVPTPAAPAPTASTPTAPAPALTIPRKFVLAPGTPSGIRITEGPLPSILLKSMRTEVSTVQRTSQLPEEVVDK